MNTLKLKKFNRAYIWLLGLLLAGAATLQVIQIHAAAQGVASGNLRDKINLPILIGPGAPPSDAFYVQSYMGKCVEFTPPTHPEISSTTIIGGTPVFVNDCNRTAAQQVRVEELKDRPGHLVVLHVGGLVIGRKVNLVFTQQASTSAQSASTSITPAPLEAQAYTGSEGQIFALDGDSIILAADRSLIVEIQNGHNANKMPLVLGPRDLADSEFWSLIAADGSSRRPTSGFVRVSQATEFVNAIQSATPGTVVEVDPNASINLTGHPVISIPDGVTIRGDRRGTLMGPEVWTSNALDGTLLGIDGIDVRITGLRLRGPSRSTDEDSPKARGIIFDRGNLLYSGAIVDHNDISDWPIAGVDVRGGDLSDTCQAGDDQRPLSRPVNVRVARNFIHHNRMQELGYGVVVSNGGYALVEGNVFVSNRHAIAADGRARTMYRAWSNLVLSDAPEQKKLGGIISWHTQDFDMHGTDNSWFGLDPHVGGTGGLYVEIAGNTFLGTNRENFDLRGTPCYLAELHRNISLRSRDDAINNDGAESKLVVGASNQFNSANPTLRLGVGDFDGDGKDDLFLATGAAWYYSPAGNAEWRFLGARSDKLENLRFGDFDGDGRTDVFTQHGRNWDVSWGGASAWEKINESGEALSDFVVGDFDGDHKADVFYASGTDWFISYGGVGQFTHFASAIHRVSDLRFGDFNGDGKTDVFGVVGDLWMVVYGGTHYWTPLRAKLTDSVASLVVADFNGDGRADVAVTHSAHGPKMTALVWDVSVNGAGEWTRLRAATGYITAALIGRFDGNASADILLWHDAYLDIVPGGSGAAVRQSRQDMR